MVEMNILAKSNLLDLTSKCPLSKEQNIYILYKIPFFKPFWSLHQKTKYYTLTWEMIYMIKI